MKVLIIGSLGTGKSTLAYEINKRFNLSRLNLDEVCRNPLDGSYYSYEERFEKLNKFLKKTVIEGSQHHLYEKTIPDLIVDI